MPGITARRFTTTIDPVTKTVYGKIKIGVANNPFGGLFNDDDTTPRVYKTTWILYSTVSGYYVDDETVVRDKKTIQFSTDIELGCANTGVMYQQGEGKLPFNNVPADNDAVNIFHKMH